MVKHTPEGSSIDRMIAGGLQRPGYTGAGVEAIVPHMRRLDGSRYDILVTATS